MDPTTIAGSGAGLLGLGLALIGLGRVLALVHARRREASARETTAREEGAAAVVPDLREMIEELRTEVRALGRVVDEERRLRRHGEDQIRELRYQLEEARSQAADARSQAAERIRELELRIVQLEGENERFRSRCPRDPQACATLAQ